MIINRQPLDPDDKVILHLEREKYDYREAKSIYDQINSYFDTQDVLLSFKDIDIEILNVKSKYSFRYGDRKF